MSRAIEDLMHEHEAILFALEILDAIGQRMAAGEAVDPADLAAFIGFLQEFADKCHHGKEEGMLFPALVAAGVPQQDGPVGVMLHEHTLGRQWIHDMDASLRPTLDASAFVRAARGYADLLRAHVQKENEVLFPMAERLLSAARLDALFEAFEAHEEQVIGAGRHEQLHGLLKAWKAKYLPA